MVDKVTRHMPTTEPAAAEAGHHPLVSLRDEVDRLFDTFFPSVFGRALFDRDPWRSGALRAVGDLAPHVDVKELADHYEIAAELPGVEVKDVKVSIDKGMLGISGEKHAEKSETEAGMRLSERSFGSFARSFRLPDDADPAAVTAEFVNGVLTVTVPRHEAAAPEVKTIEIKTH